MAQGYSKTDLCGVGFAPEQADLLALRVENVIATGSVLSQAATSVADVVKITSVGGGNDGFKVRDGNAFSRRQVVINATSTTLKLYPPSSSASLNNQSAGDSVSIASGVGAAIDTLSETLFWVRS